MIGHFAYEDIYIILMYVLPEEHLKCDAGVEEE